MAYKQCSCSILDASYFGHHVMSLWVWLGGWHQMSTKLFLRMNHYNKYCILCHMVFYATMLSFLMTLLTNKFTNTIVILTYFYFIHFWYIMHPNFYVTKHFHKIMKSECKHTQFSESICNVVII